MLEKYNNYLNKFVLVFFQPEKSKESLNDKIWYKKKKARKCKKNAAK